jgi:hypothetical protein
LSLLELDSNKSNDLVSLSPTPISSPPIITSPLTYHNNSTENTNNMTSIKKDKNDDDEEKLTCGYTPKIYSSKNYVSFINSLEKYGINLNDFTIEELFQIVDLSLKMNYSGELRYDKNNNLLSIHSKDKSKSLVILTILLSSYLLNLKYKIDISPKISEISDDIKIDTFFIKFSKSLR